MPIISDLPMPATKRYSNHGMSGLVAENSHADEALPRHLHPAVVRVWQLVDSIVAGVCLLLFVVLATMAVLMTSISFGLLAAAALALAAVFVWSATVFSGYRYQAWTYAVREHDLTVSFGVWWRTRRCVPRARVQHVDIASGPIDRAFGLVSVSIYTAGTIAAVVTIPGVDPAEAEWLRAQLLTDGGAPPPARQEPPHGLDASPAAPGDRAD